MLGRVHIVDDEPRVRSSILDLLSMIAVETTEHESTESFLVAFDAANDSETPQCVVADLRMPGMSGLDLRQELLQRECDIPVVLLTGYRDDETDVQAEKIGIFAVIDKPFSARELLAIVQQALAARSGVGGA